MTSQNTQAKTLEDISMTSEEFRQLKALEDFIEHQIDFKQFYATSFSLLIVVFLAYLQYYFNLHECVILFVILLVLASLIVYLFFIRKITTISLSKLNKFLNTKPMATAELFVEPFIHKNENIFELGKCFERLEKLVWYIVIQHSKSTHKTTPQNTK